MSDDALRPPRWEGYIGQEALKHRLDIHIASAQAQKTRLPHMLFVAPPGVGKTSLAQLVARRMYDPWEVLDQPLSASALTNLIYRFEEGILILDEIHRYPKSTQNDLLPLIEDGYLRTGNGTTKCELPYLTIIGITTDPQYLIKPLYERFEASCLPPFEEYSDEELQTIVLGMAKQAGVKMDAKTAMTLGRASGGIPRTARQFIIAARDLGYSNLDAKAEDILDFCQVDPDGLTRNHMAYLKILEDLGGTKGVGLKQICAMIRLDEGVVRDLERLLFKRGLVVPTPTGRALMPAGAAKVRRHGVRAA